MPTLHFYTFHVYDPTAPIKADQGSVPVLSQQHIFLLNIPIGHNSSINYHTSIFTANEVKKPDIFQIGLGEVSIANPSFEQLGSHQFGTTQVGIDQISVSQIGVFQPGTFEDSTFEIGFNQVSSGQSSTSESSSTQISPTQISSGQVSSSQVSSDRISLTQIDSRNFNAVQLNFSQINPSEIPLPSSITLQQLLTSHNPNPQNTTVPTWTEFLQSPTPFNLKLEIADLPTGQLASASITGYDTKQSPQLQHPHPRHRRTRLVLCR